MSILRQTRARSGYSLVELALAVGMLGFGMLSFGATQLEGFAQSAKGCDYRGAVEIARGQLELVQILPWDRLVPTDGFTAPSWIDVPGYSPGELPAYACGGASSLTGGRTYRVEWRVSDADAAGTSHDVDLRVMWSVPDRPDRSYAILGSRSR